ncbi:MAG: GGDEF domain-containing protein [Gammaproteobacteria bacterium]|nr:GGDEF domain-containing protein [Gammaproteobacteria bacterium]
MRLGGKRVSRRDMLLIFMVGVIALAQFATITTVLTSTRQQLVGELGSRLQIGERYFNSLVAVRHDRLVNAAQRVAGLADYSSSVKENNAQRIGNLLAIGAQNVSADIAMLVGSNGDIIASNKSFVAAEKRALLADLLNRQAAKETFLVAMTIAERPYQLAFVRPDSVATAPWIVMGYDFDSALAGDIKSMTGLDVSFWSAADTNSEAFFATTLAEKSTVLFSRRISGPAGVDGNLMDKGGENLMRLVSLPGGGENAVQAVFQTSVAAALGPYQSLKLRLVLLSLVLVLLAAVVAVLVVRTSRKPVRDLLDAARRIERGEYSKVVPVGGEDDIGLLARTFNRMQQGIAEREYQIASQAERDKLTGLVDRSAVKNKLIVAFERAMKSETTVATLLVDLTQVKENSTLGIENEDAILKEVARRLSSNIRVSDTVARYSSDKFLVIMEDADEKLAPHLAEFLATSLEADIVLKDRRVKLKLHVGVALFPQHCDTPDTLLHRTKVALKEARKQGQSVMVYEPGQDEEHLRELAIISDLELAIKSKQLHVLFQPKVSMRTGRANQVEALIRWNHPQLGYLPPDEFIPLLEQAGNIGKLTEFALKTVIEQSRKWSSDGLDVTTAINLSANDLFNQDLPDKVAQILSYYMVEPANVVLEITESAVMQDVKVAISVLRRLKALGVRLSLDDFGTGQSSLALLKQLPVDELKIDKSFVQGLKAKSGDALIVKSTINLGHNMGLKVVAEGLETEDAWALLDAYGCDMVQGYMISRPMTADDFVEWYLKRVDEKLHELDYSAAGKSAAGQSFQELSTATSKIRLRQLTRM